MRKDIQELMETVTPSDEKDFKKAVARYLWQQLTRHSPERGGTLCLITGEQGSGKTTLMLTLAKIYLEQGEYVIWRGREVEQIHLFPNFKEKTIFFFHENDEFEIYDVRGSVSIPIADELNIETYSTTTDLFKKLRNDKINVVFEPSVFYFDESLKMLDYVRQTIGMKIAEKTMHEPQKPEFFWFEFIYVLTRKKNTYWYALFFDEVDDLMPEAASGLQWKLQLWLKDHLKDMRKKRISFIASTHSIADVDYRIRSKIQFWIYMKNAQVPEHSLVNKDLPNYLKVGEAIIDNGLFGYIKIPKLEVPKEQAEMGDLLVLRRPKEPVEESESNEEERQISKKTIYNKNRYRRIKEMLEENLKAIEDDPESIFADIYEKMLYGGDPF